MGKNKHTVKNKNILRKSGLFLFFSLLLFLLFSVMGTSLAANEGSTLVLQNCNSGTCTDIIKNKLSKKFTIGDQIKLRILIKNPESAPIYSVQSWIKYNPTIFSVENLSDSNSAFELAAPGEFKAKNDVGEIRIGRAVMGTSVNSSEIIVADFTLEVKKNPNGATLEFMEFKSSDIGKTAVITIEKNIPANIVTQKPKGLQFVSVRSSLKPAAGTYSKPKNLQEIQNGENVYGIEQGSESYSGNNGSAQEVIALPRPQGYRARTYEDGRVEHLWKAGEDERVTGYYLYYSTTSGKYMHRRDVGKTNIYRFKNDFFKKGKRIYFALQSYTAEDQLSDFSDETYVVIGTEGSESHPFFEQIFPDAQKTGQDENSIYYGAEVTNEGNKNILANTSAKNKYSKPKTSPQSGFDIPFPWFLFMGGFIMFFGGRMVLKD